MHKKKHNTSPKLMWPVFMAFFVSGVSGLMHQIVWAKLLVQLIGATGYAQAVVLAVFMGGLALGSLRFGRRSDRQGKPLWTYVVLELMIGAYCLLLPFFLQLAGIGYVSLANHFFGYYWIRLLLRFALAVSVVFIPAFLMGGTLPVLARHIIGRVEDTRRQVASLYALNSLGAVLGAGCAGFLMLPLYGIYPSLVIASVLNFAAAALVYGQAKRKILPAVEFRSGSNRQKAKDKPRQPDPTLHSYRPEVYVATLGALALSGFAAMGYEVIFIRIIALSFGSSAYSFTVMLMCFITGIAVGSTIVSRFSIERPLWLLAASQLAVVVSLLLATPLVSRLPYLIALLRIELIDVRLGFEYYQLGKAFLCLAVLMLPTTCLGFSFPVVAQIQARHSQQIGTRVGSTYAWNTLGNVLGVVVTSLVLLPGLGLLGSFHANLALNFSAGLALLLVAREGFVGRRVAVGVAAGVVVIFYLATGTGWLDSINLARNHLRLRSGPKTSLGQKARARHPASSFEAWKRTYVARETEMKYFFFDEDEHNSVLVSGNDKNIQLCVNGKPDAATRVQDLDTQLLLAHAPLFLAPQARTILVIGHGSGITAGSALRHPIERADIVEISRAVLNADFLFWKANYGVLGDPRVQTYLDDGQSFLRTSPNTYDVIISEPSNPWIAGIGGLFTKEFFKAVRSKLNTGGVFTLWFHAYEQSNSAVALVFRTLATVFPHVMVFGDNDLSNLIAVASSEKIRPDFAIMEQRYKEIAIRNDLARIGVPNLAGLLSHHRISQNRFSAMLDSGPVNTVGHERLEYIAPRSFFLGESSYLFDKNDPLVQGVKQRTDILLDHYIAYRAAIGNPLPRKDLEDTARYVASMGGYGQKVATAIVARSRLVSKDRKFPK